MFLISIARQNFSALLKAVMLMETYWAGVTYVTNILEKRERKPVEALLTGVGSGVTRSNPRTLKKTYISLPDKGLLRRFTTGERLYGAGLTNQIVNIPTMWHHRPKLHCETQSLRAKDLDRALTGWRIYLQATQWKTCHSLQQTAWISRGYCNLQARTWGWEWG